ncbi:N/A [soil metagenome]
MTASNLFRLSAVHLAAVLVPVAAVAAGPDLAELTIEELSHLTVASVSRRPESLANAPASIYVITGDQIRRSGAVTIPEALRLAPNLQVARVSAREWAISARGFLSDVANKLLVLIDGRTVYTPLFSGVFWDEQDLVLADVERIEVISGPGAATWGVNAVNGVINIITRPAAETEGTLTTLGIGTRESIASLRHGGSVGEQGFYRVYGKAYRAEATDGGFGSDQWQRGSIGLRTDLKFGADAVTIDGGAIAGESEESDTAFGLNEAWSTHLHARWAREDEHGRGFVLQGYYLHSDRDEVLVLREDVFDLALTQSLSAGAHRLTWGAGYRYVRDGSDSVPEVAFIPEERNLRWYHVFGQDQYPIADDVELTVGVRFEHNSYTDWEVLPSLRLAWTAGRDMLVWGALSRAVRAPSRLDRDLFVPGLVAGGPDFQSEIANVAELGWRAQPTAALSYSVTGFYHRYDRLRSLELAPPGSAGPTGFGNGIEGDVTGLEAWGAWQATPDWQLAIGGFIMDQDLQEEFGSTNTIALRALGNDPDYQLQVRSRLNLSLQHKLDIMLRHVDDLPDPAVPSYTAVDVRFGWQFAPEIGLSLLLQDLLDSSHGEFGDQLSRREFERAAYLQLVWRP